MVSPVTNNMTNKFDIHWQYVRVLAKNFKKLSAILGQFPDELVMVKKFFENSPNEENRKRIDNWIRMKIVAVSGTKRDECEDFLKYIENFQIDRPVSNLPLDEFRRHDIEYVLQDLSKRKYAFQYNKTPQAHVDFVQRMQDILNKGSFNPAVAQRTDDRQIQRVIFRK